jgi:hypothetical protein
MMLCNIIQLMTLDEVNTTMYQPQRSDYHQGHPPRWYSDLWGWYIVVLTEIQSHQLFYYMSKSEVSDILFLFHCNSRHKNKKKYAVSQGNTWASLLSTCDFHRKMNKIQNKQNVAKRKTMWSRHKSRRCITSCCLENADWIAKPL